MRRQAAVFFLLLLGFSCVACAPLEGVEAWLKDEPYEQDPIDPFESTNRAVYEFNNAFDQAFFRPLAQGYDKVMPELGKDCVSNFFANLGEPKRFIAHAVRWNRGAMIDTAVRFVSNTALGGFGCFDVATAMHVPERSTDLGLALQAYDSVSPAPYIHLPFFGSSSFLALPADLLQESYFNPLTPAAKRPYPQALHFLPDHPYATSNSGLRTSIRAVESVAGRAALLGADEIVYEQFDPYLFVRDYYYQNRAARAAKLTIQL